jgi:hypothetical protein
MAQPTSTKRKCIHSSRPLLCARLRGVLPMCFPQSGIRLEKKSLAARNTLLGIHLPNRDGGI